MNRLSLFFQTHRHVITAILCFSAYLSLSPLRLFFLNRDHFNFDAALLTAACLCMFAVLTLALLLLVSQLNSQFATIFRNSLFAITITLFVYDNVLYFLVPELDGEARAVTSPFLYLIDFAIVAVIVVSFFKNLFARTTSLSNVLYFVVLVAAIQMVVAILLAESPLAERDVNAPPRVALSKELNVIHVLFDTLQSTEFSAARAKLESDDAFDGFTWFKNTLGVGWSTTLTLPSIFTGEMHDEGTIGKYYRGEERTFLDALSDNDIEINVYRSNVIPVPKGATSQHIKALARLSPKSIFDNSEEIGQLFDLFLIRVMPFVFKEFFLADYQFFFGSLFSRGETWGNDLGRLELTNFKNSLFVDPSPDARQKYYYLHLIYPHPPYSHNEDCTLADPDSVGGGDEQFAIEISCAVRDFAEFLNRLRELGVYDETLIIFHADTGGPPIHVESLKGTELPRNVFNGLPFPMLAVKPLGARGRLVESDLPASIVDIPNTIVGDLEFPREFGGVDLFSDRDLRGRQRRFGDFVVDEDPFAAESWSKYEPNFPDRERVAIQVIRSGDIVDFTVVGRGHLFRDTGWSSARGFGTWAFYPSSVLQMSLNQTSANPVKSLRFRIQFRDNVEVPISYKVNDGPEENVEVVPIGKGSEYEFRIPVDPGIETKIFKIEFIMRERIRKQTRVFAVKNMTAE